MNLLFDPIVESAEEAAKRQNASVTWMIPDTTRPGAMIALGFTWVDGAWAREPDPEKRSARTAVVRLAYKFHGKQTRRDGKLLYTSHLERVYKRVAGDFYAELLAWVHDLLEDTAATVQDLYDAGLPDMVVWAAEAMNHKKGVPYDVYIKRVRTNALAVSVKLPDILDNITGQPTKHQLLKYANAITLLLD